MLCSINLSWFRGWVALLTLTIAVLVTSCGTPAKYSSGTYEDLVVLFQEWREFEKPEFINGIPDYSSRSMNAQRDELVNWQARLHALDPVDWSVEEQIDWHLARAEMNGL